MSASHTIEERDLGLLPATGVGVGAIVGGGVLALAGVAFATSGPSAILAFALNGGIALLTALSFAELASRFPQSGGTYTYARKVLTIEAAFGVGWVVWFASVVAAVLYALGFAVFLVPFLEALIHALGGEPPAWLGGRIAALVLALLAVGGYALALLRSTAGGGQWATVGKVVVFGFLILAGFFVLVVAPPSLHTLGERFQPFLARGGSGLLQAMGYTFIALQGFDLIAAVGGRVQDPQRNIPRAMLLSLGTALVIYLPLLFLIVAVGSPELPISQAAAKDPEILVATATRAFLGPSGYWLVLVAGLLSMLSALHANLLAASAFARTMAMDRTLPPRYAELSGRGRTPRAAIFLTTGAVTFVLIAVPDVATAGAVSSLIFLASFTLAHGIAYLARKRGSQHSGFQTRAFPLVPALGGVSCLALGLYQAVAVPSAGVLAALWLSLGAMLYVTLLAPRARTVDAGSEAFDPEILKLRGRTPLVLVPIANPASAPTLVKLASALSPGPASRIQLLSVVRRPEVLDSETEGLAQLPALVDAQQVLGGALAAALETRMQPEALITLSDDPWSEIARIARRTRCQRVLLGVGELGPEMISGPLEHLVDSIDADVVILRAPPGWRPEEARRILIPARGGVDHGPIRARLLGSLLRAAPREITFLGVLPADASREEDRRVRAQLALLCRDEAPRASSVEVIHAEAMTAEVAAQADRADLMILGLQRRRGGRLTFGKTLIEIATATRCPLLMISQKA
ncbi:MAG: amino acid permease [Deltaproteobacteria bacterium]|nr:amino acid permease [Deltaproteobacteria bacterium]